MYGYFLIMLSVSVIFFIIGIMIYRGKTNLIHDYHQTNIDEKDKKAYGKDFSKGIILMASAFAVSGIVSLFGETVLIIKASVSVLFAGIAAAFVIIFSVQKKYNGGIF